MIPSALDWCEACGQARRWWCPECTFVFCYNPTCRIHSVPVERQAGNGPIVTVCRACSRR